MSKIIEISNWIESHSSEIIENIDFESVDVYEFLKREFLNSKVNENFLFQFVFRSFYRLDNAGLTPAFKTEYFKILEQNRNIEKLDFEKVLRRLYEIPNRKGQNTFQFSFVTKMYNTINDSIPIYDSEVAKMFSLTRPYQPEFELKLEAYLNHFSIIQNGYEEVINQNLLPKTKKMFDRKFVNNGLSEIKKLDFIFWSSGKLKSNSSKSD